MKGKNNVVADALSRIPSTLSLMEIFGDWKSLLPMEYSKNKFSCKILNGLIQDDKYHVVDDIIYYKGRIYLVLESQLKEKIMQAARIAPLAQKIYANKHREKRSFEVGHLVYLCLQPRFYGSTRLWDM